MNLTQSTIYMNMRWEKHYSLNIESFFLYNICYQSNYSGNANVAQYLFGNLHWLEEGNYSQGSNKSKFHMQ